MPLLPLLEEHLVIRGEIEQRASEARKTDWDGAVSYLVGDMAFCFRGAD